MASWRDRIPAVRKYGKARAARRRPLLSRMLWIGLWVTASVAGWIDSVAYASHASQPALVFGSWSAGQSSRIKAQAEQRRRRFPGTGSSSRRDTAAGQLR
jgi:hypothetical protein